MRTCVHIGLSGDGFVLLLLLRRMESRTRFKFPLSSSQPASSELLNVAAFRRAPPLLLLLLLLRVVRFVVSVSSVIA